MDSQSYSTRFQVKAAPMAACAVLLGVGASMAICGMVVGTAGMVSIARKWWAEVTEQAPQAMKPKFNKQAKIAMAEGTRVMSGNGAPAHSGRS